jgi:hypothetical protein
VNKTFRSNSGKIRTVGIYDSFPTYEDDTELFEQFGGGKYTILCIAPRRIKVGYYEFEGEDRYPEEEETPVKPKKLKLKYKPRDFKEALLLKRLEEGDEQLIRQITDAEFSSQGILRNDSDMPVIQQHGVDLKEHFDKIEELKEEIHKRDMQIIEERFSKGGAGGGWESFMLESSAGKELGREALETIREIFRTTKRDDYPGEEDDETFDEYKALPPAKEKLAKDYAPLKILIRFIENNGGPSAYLETMSISYPDHPFCQTLITCQSAGQLLEKLKTLKLRLPALFTDAGKAWLEELFEIIRKFESDHEPVIETEDRADHQAASQCDAAAVSGTLNSICLWALVRKE